MTLPETKSALGVGIIGCGNISSDLSAPGAALWHGIDVRAVADLNRDAAMAQAEAFGTTAMSVDDLLASQDIDIVVNLTVPGAHFGVTKRILEAGKHAYSEKPVVFSLEEGETLRTLANSKALRIGSAPDTFLGGAHQMARALLDDGAVGRITSGTCHVMNHGMEMWHPNPDFFFLPGAGPMLDIGPYYITNLLQLLGPCAPRGSPHQYGHTHAYHRFAATCRRDIGCENANQHPCPSGIRAGRNDHGHDQLGRLGASPRSYGTLWNRRIAVFT